MDIKFEFSIIICKKVNCLSWEYLRDVRVGQLPSGLSDSSPTAGGVSSSSPSFFSSPPCQSVRCKLIGYTIKTHAWQFEKNHLRI